jgi:hypothetical protein
VKPRRRAAVREPLPSHLVWWPHPGHVEDWLSPDEIAALGVEACERLADQRATAERREWEAAHADDPFDPATAPPVEEVKQWLAGGPWLV